MSDPLIIKIKGLLADLNDKSRIAALASVDGSRIRVEDIDKFLMERLGRHIADKLMPMRVSFTRERLDDVGLVRRADMVVVNLEEFEFLCQSIETISRRLDMLTETRSAS